MSKPLSKNEYDKYMGQVQFEKLFKFFGSTLAASLNVLVLMLLAWLGIAIVKGMLWTIRWVI